MSKNSNCNSCKKSLRFFGPDLQNLNLQDSRSERIQQRWYNIFTTTNIQEHPPRVFQENWNTIITDCYLSFLHSETKIKAGYRLKTFPCKWHLKSSFSGNTYWKHTILFTCRFQYTACRLPKFPRTHSSNALLCVSWHKNNASKF